MKKVRILGSGCARCQKLLENTEEAARLLGVAIDLEKVSDLTEIMEFGLLSLPGLVIDGKLIASGRLLKPEEITPYLR